MLLFSDFSCCFLSVWFLMMGAGLGLHLAGGAKGCASPVIALSFVSPAFMWLKDQVHLKGKSKC